MTPFPIKEDLNDPSGPPSRSLELRQTSVHSGGLGCLSSPGEARNPGKSWQSPPLTTLGHFCRGLTPSALGRELQQSVGVVPALLQGPGAGLERRQRPGRPPATGGAAGASTKDRARGVQPALRPPASDAILGRLGALRALPLRLLGKRRAPETHAELGKAGASSEAD